MRETEGVAKERVPPTEEGHHSVLVDLQEDSLREHVSTAVPEQAQLVEETNGIHFLKMIWHAVALSDMESLRRAGESERIVAIDHIPGAHSARPGWFHWEDEPASPNKSESWTVADPWTRIQVARRGLDSDTVNGKRCGSVQSHERHLDVRRSNKPFPQGFLHPLPPT